MKAKHALPVVLMIAFALTRVPGLLPVNFSAVYGLLFCAGVYFSGRMAWWLPLTTLFVTDLALNAWYDAPLLAPEMLGTYLTYAGLILLGRSFSHGSSFLALLGGGVFGAILFYLVTNTISWLFDPHYLKTVGGWVQALTVGRPEFPHTWEFFRNTLLSGGLFTGLFAGAMKLSEAMEPKEEAEPEPEAEPQAEPAEAEPGEAKA